MKRKKYNPRLQAIYLEIVENQLRDNTPPEARQTLSRLKTMGYSDRDAKLLIASAIAAETFIILKTQQASNPDRYIGYLRRLPDQSFEEE